MSYRVSTDADGRWEMARLPAGQYRVVATRDGYVTRQYGQVQPFGLGTWIELGSGQQVDSIDIALRPGGVMTGSVLDDHGEAMGNVRVMVRRLRYVNGVRRPVAFGTYSTLTDDRGRYRIWGLPQGSYIVSAGFESSLPGQPQDFSGFAETFYPGTPRLADAEPVPSLPQADPPPINFGLLPTRVALVSGRVVTAGGPYPTSSYSVSLEPLDGREARVASGSNADFQFPSVPAGDYLLRARVVQLSPNWQGGTAEIAALPLTVTDDTRDLVLHTAPAAVLTGRAVMEIPADGPFPALSIEAIDTATGRSTQSRVSPEQHRFVLPALSGHYVFRLEGPADWWLKSVMLDGQEIIDSGVDLSSAPQAGEIQIVVTRRATTVSGSVLDDQGRPRSEYVVVAFSSDPARWTPGTRFVGSTTSRPDGTFVLQGLPAAEYVLVAVPELEIGEETNPDQLKAWRAVGTRIALTAFESRSLVLRLSR